MARSRAEPRGAFARPLRGVAIAAAFTAVLLLSRCPWAVAADDVAAAEALLAKGETEKAADAFRRLAEAPGGAEDVRVQEGLARALLASGDVQGSLGPLEVVARKRGRPEDHAAHAEGLVAVAREVIAAGGTVRSIDVVPYLQDALLALGRARGGGEALAPRLSKAEGEARRLLGDLPGAKKALSHPGLSKDAAAQDLLARVCYDLGDFSAAADAFLAAGSPRGAAYSLAAGRDRRAVAAYLALVREQPGDATLLEEAVDAATRVGDAAGMDAGLAALAPTGEARLRLLTARGRLAEKAGRPADALAFYREVLAATPEDVGAMRDLGRARLSASPEDPAAVEEATGLLTRALSKAPDDAWARKVLEWQAQRDVVGAWRDWPDRSRLDRGVGLWRVLALADPSDATGWAQYGNALRISGAAKEAVAAYDKAVEANAYDASAWNDRGLALLAAGDEGQALASFERAVTIDASDTAARQNAARLRWLSGDDPAAEAHLAAATRSARATGGHTMLYRFLLDRVWRSRVMAK